MKEMVSDPYFLYGWAKGGLLGNVIGAIVIGALAEVLWSFPLALLFCIPAFIGVPVCVWMVHTAERELRRDMRRRLGVDPVFRAALHDALRDIGEPEEW